MFTQEQEKLISYLKNLPEEKRKEMLGQIITPNQKGAGIHGVNAGKLRELYQKIGIVGKTGVGVADYDFIDTLYRLYRESEL